MAQQWQYCRLGWISASVNEEERAELVRQGKEAQIVTDEGAMAVRIATLRVFGPDGYKTSVTDVEAEIGALGLAGWELVSHTVTTTPGSDGRMMGSVTLYFKRPIEKS